MLKQRLFKISSLFASVFVLLILGQKTLDILQIKFQTDGIDLLEMLLLLACMICFSWALVQESDEDA